MEHWLDIVLWVHIAGGSVAVASGLVAILSRKGGGLHRGVGKAYFGGMTIVFITAVILGLAHWNPFLLLVGVFSFQLVVFGYRSLYHKQLHRKKVPRLDYLIVGVAGFGDICLIGLGGWWLSGGQTMGAVAIVFGIIGLLFTRRVYRKFNSPPVDKKHWLKGHLSGMMGGYIATVTAVLVVNVQIGGLNWLLWLFPTIVLTPVIFYYNRKHSRPRSEG